MPDDCWNHASDYDASKDKRAEFMKSVTRVIFFHVGKGDLALLLFPNGKAALVDCYKVHKADELTNTTKAEEAFGRIKAWVLEHRKSFAPENSAERTRWFEAVGKEERGAKKIPIWVLFVSHADRDHIETKKRLFELFDIEILADNGRDYADPSAAQKDYLKLREYMKKERKYAALTRAAKNVLPDSGVAIDALCPNRGISPEEDANNQCLVLRASYAGRSFLFTGDTPIDDWSNAKYGINVLHGKNVTSEFLKVSHHGSRTFFTPPAPRPEGQPPFKKEEYDCSGLKLIAPRMSFITCSDDEDAEHPDSISLEIYQENTNASLSNCGSSHVYLSRETQNLHFAVDANGGLFARTSRTRCNHSGNLPRGKSGYLTGNVKSSNGYLDASGIWVVRSTAGTNVDISFEVFTKGTWSSAPEFDWRVINNGFGRDELHREFYGMESKDKKKSSSWSRPLVFEGVHVMQCHASTEDGSQWANWAVVVCFEECLPIARRWMAHFPSCIDPMVINK
jgi:hypothetical protein